MENRRQTISSQNTQYIHRDQQQGSNLNRISSEPLFVSHQRNYSQQDKFLQSNSRPKVRSKYRLNLDGVILSRQNQQYDYNSNDQMRLQHPIQDQFSQIQHLSNEQNYIRQSDLQLIQKGFYSDREMFRNKNNQVFPQTTQHLPQDYKINEIKRRQDNLSQSKYSSKNSYSQPKKFKYVKKLQKNFNVDKKMKEIKNKKLKYPRQEKLKYLESKAEQMEQLVDQLEQQFSSKSSDDVRDSYKVQNTYFPERAKVTKLFITKRNTINSQDTLQPLKNERQTVLKVKEYKQSVNKELLFKLEKQIKQLEKKLDSMQHLKTQNYKLKRDLLKRTAQKEFYQDKQKELESIINNLENKYQSIDPDEYQDDEYIRQIQEQDVNEQNLLQRIENLNKKIQDQNIQKILQQTVNEFRIIKEQQNQSIKLLKQQNEKLMNQNFDFNVQKSNQSLRKSQSQIQLSENQNKSFEQNYQNKIKNLKQMLKERDNKLQILEDENASMNKKMMANFEMIKEKQEFYDNVIRSNKKNMDQKESHYESFTKQQQKELDDLRDQRRDLKTKLEIEKLKNRESFDIERTLREKINRLQLKLEEKKILEISYQNQIKNNEKEISFQQQNLKDQKRNHEEESVLNREKYQELIRSIKEQQQIKVNDLEKKNQELNEKFKIQQKDLQELKSQLKQEKQKAFKIQDNLNDELKQTKKQIQEVQNKNENLEKTIRDLKFELNEKKTFYDNEITKIKNKNEQNINNMQQKFLEEKNKQEQKKLREQEQLLFSKFQEKNQLEQEFDQNIIQMESQYERLKKDYLSALKENENLSEEKQYLLDSMQKSTENLKVLRENLKETEIQFSELKKIFYDNQETQDKFLDKKENLENENLKLVMVCKQQEEEIQNKQDQLDKLLIHSFQLTIFGKFLTRKLERQQSQTSNQINLKFYKNFLQHSTFLMLLQIIEILFMIYYQKNQYNFNNNFKQITFKIYFKNLIKILKIKNKNLILKFNKFFKGVQINQNKTQKLINHFFFLKKPIQDYI